MKIALFLLLLISNLAYAKLSNNEFALTFDDGPSEKETLRILDDLDRVNDKATFFVVGNMTKGREWIVQEEIARGHDVGCHSMSHPLMTKLKKSAWQKEISDCVETVEKITGKKPTLFRFPYGACTKEMKEYAESYGMKVIRWDIDSFDWERGSQKEIEDLEADIKEQKKGIILMHDIQKSTMKILPDLLDFLKDLKVKIVLLD